MKPTLFFILAIALASCNNAKNTSATAEDSNPTDTVKMGEPISLFDGQTLNGWHGFNKSGAVTNWTIEDGALVCLGAAQGDTGGDIVSDAEYENFEFSWEWKVTPGGNSGVMYHVVEDAKYKAPYETGPEYQMIDDEGFPEKLEDWQKTAADYAMYTPNERKKVMPVGEWNTSKIIFNRGHVEHWLNGEKVIEFTAWDDAWTKLKTEGKWKDFPDYGSAKKGRIALQDHGNKVYFRNITILEL